MEANGENWRAALAAGEAALAHQVGDLAPSAQELLARIKDLERKMAAFERRWPNDAEPLSYGSATGFRHDPNEWR